MVNFVICEFNPFHNGHKYLLSRLNEPVVCIMSGQAVQRGEFAVTDKWTRAEMALRCGADLVLELPVAYACGSASEFARGALQIADATGLEGRLCFGTEGDSLQGLTELACISEQQLSPLIKQHLKNGVAYGTAVQSAYDELCPARSDLLTSPNNLLAFEYIKANRKFKVMGIPRIGVSHDSENASHGFISASALRQRLSEYADFVPKELSEIYQSILQSGNYLDSSRLDIVWLSDLRRISKQEWQTIAPDGLGIRFWKSLESAQNIEELLNSVKVKCFTYSSLRRTALKGMIGAPTVTTPQYIRVLGANDTGKQLLRQMNPTLPLLIKPAKVKELSQSAQAQFDFESRVTDLFMYCLKAPRSRGLEYSSPVIL